MLNQPVHLLKVVVASPVQSEREALPAIIEELNRGIAADRGLRLELIAWKWTPTQAFILTDGRS